jgi:hypothetical protein
LIPVTCPILIPPAIFTGDPTLRSFKKPKYIPNSYPDLATLIFASRAMMRINIVKLKVTVKPTFASLENRIITSINYTKGNRNYILKAHICKDTTILSFNQIKN